MGGGGGGGLTNGACVAQQYVPRPLLIDGFKFDLRLYVLVTACSPLRVYMFHNGLVRLCTKAYEAPDASNLGDHCMHLTNYAINKHSENFVPNEFAEEQDAGSKRSLAWFMEWFAERHGDGRAALLWQRMGFLCTKMLLPILPTLQREYGEVFEKKKKQKNVAKENEKGSHHHHPTTMTDDEAAKCAKDAETVMTLLELEITKLVRDSDDDKYTMLKLYNEHFAYLEESGASLMNLDDYEELLGGYRAAVVQCFDNQLRVVQSFQQK